MYPNLEAEQARHGHTDDQIAEELGIAVEEYQARKASNTLEIEEASVLAAIYAVSTEYLFQTEARGI